MGAIAKSVFGTVAATTVGVAVAGTVIGWPVAWAWLTGWWTPGWGNLFTVLVAAAAIAVSAWFNRKTLENARLQFAQTRSDTDNANLRNEVAKFLDIAGERAGELGLFHQQIPDYSQNKISDLDTRAVKELRERYAREIRALINIGFGPVAARVGVQQLVILMLTDDPQTIKATSAIAGAIKEEQQILLAIADLVDEIAEGSDGQDVPPLNAQREQMTAKFRKQELIITEQHTALLAHLLQQRHPHMAIKIHEDNTGPRE